MVSNKLDTALAVRLHDYSEADEEAGRTRLQVLVHVVGDLSAVERAGFWTEWTAGPVAGGTVALADLERVARLDDVASIEAPRPVRLMIHDSVPAIRADVARQIPPGFNGRGVLVGVVDSGIDIFHGAFRKADNTTRIVSLLDLTMRQTISVTGSPASGSFLVEWQAPPLPGPPPTPAGPLEKTPMLPFPTTAAQLQTALEALNTINPGDIVVTGGPLPNTPIVLDFVGRYLPSNFDDRAIGLTGFTTAMPAGAKMSITFGREFTEAEINAALSSPDQKFLSRDPIGHGTHVMGIAAGDASRSGTNARDDCHRAGYYVGVAPEADLVVVHIKNTDDAVRALSHIFAQAWRPAGAPLKPVVVNMSIGTSIGPHDGTDQIELGIDGLLQGTTGKAVVVSAGNDGEIVDVTHPDLHPQAGGGTHGFKTVAANGSATFQFVISANDKTDDQFELWYGGAGRLSVNITSPGPGGASLQPPIPAGAGTQQLTLANHPIKITSDVSNPSNNRHHIGIVLQRPPSGTIATGTWTITLTETAGTATPVDCWIVLQLSDPHPRLVNADQNRTRTVSTPATARNVISVAAYDAATGDLGEFSSRGPTADGRPKPDIAAPGVGITAAKSGARNTGCKCDCCYEFYILESGTSAAAPHVTGVVALMLQANPNLSVTDIKAKLAASHFPPDPHTGTLPNTDWGAGRIDAEKAVRAAVPAPTARVAGAAAGTAGPDPDEVILLPAAAYPAAHLPLRTQLRELRLRVGGSPAGQLLAALVSEHVDEVLRLVNTDRRVMVAWHRMDGPVLLRLLLRNAGGEVPVPRTLAGKPVAGGLARLLDALAGAGSPALRAAVVTHRGLVLALPGARLSELDDEQRAG